MDEAHAVFSGKKCNLIKTSWTHSIRVINVKMKFCTAGIIIMSHRVVVVFRRAVDLMMLAPQRFTKPNLVPAAANVNMATHFSQAKSNSPVFIGNCAMRVRFVSVLEHMSPCLGIQCRKHLFPKGKT